MIPTAVLGIVHSPQRSLTRRSPRNSSTLQIEQRHGGERRRGRLPGTFGDADARSPPPHAAPDRRGQGEARRWLARSCALELLVTAEAGPLEPLQEAELAHQRGQLAFDQRQPGEAARLLLKAARRFEPFSTDSARDTHLDALRAAIWAGDLMPPVRLHEVAEAARAAPPGARPPHAMDVRLDAFAVWLTDGFTAAIPLMSRSLELSPLRSPAAT